MCTETALDELIFWKVLPVPTCVNKRLNVNKNENWFGSNFDFFIISLLVLFKY